jgi:hypothetical protein
MVSPLQFAQILLWLVAVVVFPQAVEQSAPPVPARIEAEATHGPFVSVSIPATVQPESVQIAYHLSGPFGGYYSSIKPVLVSGSYRIFTTVGGKRANHVKIVVFAPDCEPIQFDVPLDATARAGRTFQCQAAKIVNLTGQITPPELARRTNADLVIDYEPDWVMKFFGVMDGPLVTFRVTETTPKADGTFQVGLPLFAKDAADSSAEPRASFRLSLIEKQTLNSLSDDLVPEASEFRLPQRTLRISSQYPDRLKFVSAQ